MEPAAAEKQLCVGNALTSIHDDIWYRIAGFLDPRDVAAFRASCRTFRKAAYSRQYGLVLDAGKRPFVNWGNTAWFKRFLASISQLRSIKTLDPGKGFRGFQTILRACLDAARRSGSPVDYFSTGSPLYAHELMWAMDLRRLASIDMESPSLLGGVLSGTQLAKMVVAFPALEEISLRGYQLATVEDVDSEDGQEEDGDEGEDDEGQDEDADEGVGDEGPEDEGQDGEVQEDEGGEEGEDGVEADGVAGQGDMPGQGAGQREGLDGQGDGRDQQQQLAVDREQPAGQQHRPPETEQPLEPVAAAVAEAEAADQPTRQAAQAQPPQPQDAAHQGRQVQPDSTDRRTVLFHPQLLAPLAGSLRVLRLHCWGHMIDRVQEDWALALAALPHLTTLDLAEGMGVWSALRSRSLGMPIPWTRAVAEAWRQGLKHLEFLSVRLVLQDGDYGDDEELPLQQHALPLPVSERTAHLGVYFDHFGDGLEDDEEEVNAALGVMASTFGDGRCAGSLESLDFMTPRVGTAVNGGYFRLSPLRNAPAGEPLSRLARALLPGRLPRLRRLTLAADTAALLSEVLPGLVAPGGEEQAAGGVTATPGDFQRSDTSGGVVTTVVVHRAFLFTDLLAALHALRGSQVVLRLAAARQLFDFHLPAIQHTLAFLGELAGSPALQGLEASPDSCKAALQERLEALGGLQVAYDHFLLLPPVRFPENWERHLKEQLLLGEVRCLTRISLTFSRTIQRADVRKEVRWHLEADVDSHLAALAEACPRLRALELLISEESLIEEGDPGDFALTSWRGAKAAARAGADLHRWRPPGIASPVPRLCSLADLPSLEELSLEFDVVCTYGLSGLVEDEVRQLIETMARRRQVRRQQAAAAATDSDTDAGAGAGGGGNVTAQRPGASEPAAASVPLRVWCPLLSRDAARRLSRLSLQLLGPGAGGVGLDDPWVVDCTYRGTR